MKQMTQPKGWPLMLVAIFLLAAIAAKGLLIQPRSAPSDFNAARAIQRLATVIGPQVPHRGVRDLRGVRGGHGQSAPGPL